MPDHSDRQHDLLLAQLDGLAVAHINNLNADDPESLHRRFHTFLHHYFELASPGALAARPPDHLFRIAWQHWTLASRRGTSEARLALRAPENEHQPWFAQLSTVTDDMPFLMDSLGMAIRDTGSAIDWTVHPLLRMRRDRDGQLLEVLGTADNDDSAESLIHIEFEPLEGDAEAYEALHEALLGVLHDVRCVVTDYPAMRQRMLEQAQALAQAPANQNQADCDEAAAFLRWLTNDHFTFLGYSRSRASKDEEGEFTLQALDDHGLGLTRPGERFANTDECIAPLDELRRHAQSNHLLVVTKANARSTVHHPQYMDIISVKQFADDGTLLYTHRFVGLFSLDVYISKPADIPLIRRKADYVMARSRLPTRSHSGKNLQDILHQLPRDELFQSSAEELYDTCMGIRALRDRHQLRLFMRRDRYGRFYSCMVYLPRDRYAREMRDRMAEELMRICGGLSIDRNVDFLRGDLARMHFIVRTPPGTRIGLRPDEVEERLVQATRSWRDRLRDQLLQQSGQGQRLLANRFIDAFPLAYSSHTDTTEAATDIHYLARLSSDTPLLPRLLVDQSAAGRACPTALKLYSWQHPVALSDVLPTLENFGLRVVRQDPTRVTPRDGEVLWIQAFEVRVQGDCALPQEALKDTFETAFLKCWHGDSENDSLHQLVLTAGLNWRQIVCLRVLTRYLLQTGLPYSQHYMAQLLSEHNGYAHRVVSLFEARFDPQRNEEKRQQQGLALAQALDDALDKVTTLDADRVLRGYLDVVRATLRTNFFQTDGQGRPRAWISLKLDPQKLPELPHPRPMFETFVYSPDMEAIHLRGGKVARGGLRWSDRREDFRTEVLGLVKAQMVKNAIIVPVGAKGGFVVKRGDPTDRDTWLAQGQACYRTFLRGLLDITDNRDGDRVVPPPDVVRYDDDDPYLVVAADKGTATFSDIANDIAAEYGFWLGDAFASGGSAGYDHKKMGITARGAWESVKRHFREQGKDIQTQDFTVVGIGDMGGDVFGNGMLLSPHICLVAAFNHQHIFIDPTPDAASSFAERQRLFALPRSGWQDYDSTLISEGGGVWPRSAKSITLSDQARAALDIEARVLTPNELIRAILCAPVELLFNGGIGTWVKASHESHQDVGDRANDSLRVNARALRCQVVGEGGNLGFTQAGRIEYALVGGCINTDAIDNAGGVHSSDREVNIKIPLNSLMQQGELDRDTRDPLLAEMTDTLAAQVLSDNSLQSLALSLQEQDAPERLDEHSQLMRALEREGLLVREQEGLPDDDTLAERRTDGAGLTRPELAVLMAYSKITLFDAVLASSVPDDPSFAESLLSYFPAQMRARFHAPLLSHRLRREIISTQLANRVVNHMGSTFVYRLLDDHGIAPADTVKAFAMAWAICDGDAYWRMIDALDNQVDARLQWRLYSRVTGLLRHLTQWLLRSPHGGGDIDTAQARFHGPLRVLEQTLPNILTASYREEWDQACTTLTDGDVPQSVATTLANTLILGSAPDIIELADEAGCSIDLAAACYFLVGDRLNMLWLLSSIINLGVQDKWQALARANLREDSYRLQRQVTARVLARPGDNAEARFEQWEAAHREKIHFSIRRLDALQAHGQPDFMTLAVGVRALRTLRNLP